MVYDYNLKIYTYSISNNKSQIDIESKFCLSNIKFKINPIIFCV